MYGKKIQKNPKLKRIGFFVLSTTKNGMYECSKRQGSYTVPSLYIATPPRDKHWAARHAGTSLKKRHPLERNTRFLCKDITKVLTLNGFEKRVNRVGPGYEK